MFSPPFSLRWLAAAGWLGMAPLVLAQASGTFVIPAFRAGGGSRFSYWDGFALPGGTTSSYFHDHFPNLLNLGDDAEPANPSNWNTNAKLQQVLTPQCFVTSSGALYSFAAATGFEITYTHSGANPVAGVLFQLRHAGTCPRPDSVRLRYQPGGGDPVLLAPAFRALDDPGTAGFGEQIIRAYEWNLTGLGVTDYTLLIESAGSSMAFYQAQLDTTTGSSFQQALGHLLSTRSSPGLRFGAAGKVVIGTEEKRFFTAGQEVPLTALANSGFNAVGWLHPDGSISGSTGDFSVTFASQNPVDSAVAAIFSPASWLAFRSGYFNHRNNLTGTADDFSNDGISGPGADPDRDGADNFSEYCFGGNPYLPDAARMAPQPVILTESGNRYPGLVYRRRAGEGDLAYQVEAGSNLMAWRSGVETTSVFTETDGPLESDGTRTVTARSLTPLTHSPVFLRVKALPTTP